MADKIRCRLLRREVARHQTRQDGTPRCRCDGPRACLWEILTYYQQLFGRRKPGAKPIVKGTRG